MTNKEIRDEFIGVKATHKTKLFFQQLKRETGNSLADIAEYMAENEMVEINIETIYKFNSLKSNLENNNKIIESLKKTVENIEKQNTEIIKKINTLTSKSAENMNLSSSMEINLKRCVNSFYKTREQNTDSFGKIKDTFDEVKIGRNICSYNATDYNTFCLCIEAIDNNKFSISDFNNKSLDELGIEYKS